MYLEHIEEVEGKWMDKLAWFGVEMSLNYVENNEIVMSRRGLPWNEQYFPCYL